MKKLLILLSLTTTMTAFADTPTTLPASNAPQGNTEKSANMSITATVIRPLRIEASAMAFGKVIQGATAKATGTYTIEGEPNQPIEVTITEPTNNQLVSNNGSPLEIKLEYTLPETTNSTGTTNFDIIGTLTPNNTHLGEYTGTVVARVQYQ